MYILCLKTSFVKTGLLDPFWSLNNSFYARIPVTKKDFLEKEGKKAFTASSLIKVSKLLHIVVLYYNTNGNEEV